MAITPTPLYQSKGNVPYVPTGYEGIRSDIASKRKIADAMMAAGMAGLKVGKLAGIKPLRQSSLIRMHKGLMIVSNGTGRANNA